MRPRLQNGPVPDSPPRVVDSHHHLWRLRDITPEGILASPYLERDFLWSDFVEAWAGLPVSATVFVQVRSDADEVGFVESVVERDQAPIGAMIAWAPLERPEAPEHLRQLGSYPLVRGVRRNTQHEADPLFCAREEYVAGARLLGELGFLCEICVRHEQLAGAIGLARACPDTTIVLEHLGKPDVSRPPAAYWLRGVEELAGLPNVFCKVSVVVHTGADQPYAAESLAPFVRHAVESFGWRRALFGSNWPVSTAVAGFRDWVDLLSQVLPGGSESERAAFFEGNARALYGLD
jgi:L-fuconolactonase